MKKIIKTALFALAFSTLILLPSCNDFEEMNENPTKPTTTDPNMQLTYIQLLTFGDFEGVESNTIYLSGMIQQLQGEWNTTNYGGQYRNSNTQLEKTWNRVYQNSLKNTIDIIDKTENKSEYENVRAVARIFRVYYSMILTDLYGDIPYSEAGLGYINGIVKPKYDKQEDIYNDFLKELTEARKDLNPDGLAITGDIIYNGNIAKWKTFANSLRLRVAMRLVKVNPELAKSEVSNILKTDAGTFKSSAEDAIVKYENFFDWDVNEFRRNGVSQFWRGRGAYPEQFICSVFWDMLKNTKDPRLFLFGRSYYDDSANDPFNRTDLTDEILKGAGIGMFQPSRPGFFWWDNWPSGYYSNTLKKWIDKATRPQVNSFFLRGDNPGILISYAESELLLSEANVRWGATLGDPVGAEQHYRNGVTAAMNILSYLDNSATVSSDKIEAFLSANPFPADSESRIKAINEQLWIIYFTNSTEGFANWRRSGYPELKPAKDYGAVTIDSQTIPRRFTYPINEATINKDAYQQAVEDMGGKESWENRVWWDKK